MPDIEKHNDLELTGKTWAENPRLLQNVRQQKINVFLGKNIVFWPREAQGPFWRSRETGSRRSGKPI